MITLVEINTLTLFLAIIFSIILLQNFVKNLLAFYCGIKEGVTGGYLLSKSRLMNPWLAVVVAFLWALFYQIKLYV